MDKLGFIEGDSFGVADFRCNLLNDRAGKKSAAPPKLTDAKVLPEIEEVVAHHG